MFASLHTYEAYYDVEIFYICFIFIALGIRYLLNRFALDKDGLIVFWKSARHIPWNEMECLVLEQGNHDSYFSAILYTKQGKYAFGTLLYRNYPSFALSLIAECKKREIEIAMGSRNKVLSMISIGTITSYQDCLRAKVRE